MANKGRKGYGEELQVLRRYSDLSGKFFAVLKENLISEDKIDRKWAVEQLGKAFVKMIPQDLTTGGQPLNINYDRPFEITQKAGGDSPRPIEVQSS